ncbi:putative cytoplasmic protein [Roseibium sp. TrichSKD4]|uniref:nuclear transport factor 2 family protein n=1 Tax=Roseibium sp. TrichSKD4 TaxID=744980 RepID=UPI0001E569DC|nr:nuclear transport factor 2 family protein [Roseibium sp. TrichSKD4]EFO31850.1 putative cytoplasmic protein [Roseibium sp. TrichSKD4]
MTQTRLRALLNTFFAAFNAGDTAQLSQLVTDDVVLDINQEQRRVGRDAFLAFNALMRQSFKERVCSLRIHVSEDGMRAGAEYKVSGSCAFNLGENGAWSSSAQERYLLSVGSFFELRGNRIARMTAYYNEVDRIARAVPPGAQLPQSARLKQFANQIAA